MDVLWGNLLPALLRNSLCSYFVLRKTSCVVCGSCMGRVWEVQSDHPAKSILTRGDKVAVPFLLSPLNQPPSAQA